MSSIRNPYNNVGNVLPPQPFGSVVDQVKNNENALIETAGLNTYSFLDVGQELNAWNDIQKVQRAAFPINRRRMVMVTLTLAGPSLKSQGFRSQKPKGSAERPDLIWPGALWGPGRPGSVQLKKYDKYIPGIYQSCVPAQ